jgi:hypothetical protein
MLKAKTKDGVTKIPIQFMQFPLQDIQWHCVKNHTVHSLNRNISTIMLN